MVPHASIQRSRPDMAVDALVSAQQEMDSGGERTFAVVHVLSFDMVSFPRTSSLEDAFRTTESDERTARIEHA